MPTRYKRRFFNKMKEEADLEQNAERCVIEFVSLWSFRCRAVLVEPFKSRIQGVGPGAPQYSGISRSNVGNEGLATAARFLKNGN